MNYTNDYFLSQSEEKLLQAVDKVISLGWKISDSITIDLNNKCCCPLAALAIAFDGSADKKIFYEEAAFEFLGCSVSQADAFVLGFDDDPFDKSIDCSWYDLGSKFRKKFLEEKS